MVKNAEILAEKYGADKETVIIAAWLHDIKANTLLQKGFKQKDFKIKIL